MEENRSPLPYVCAASWTARSRVGYPDLEQQRLGWWSLSWSGYGALGCVVCSDWLSTKTRWLLSCQCLVAAVATRTTVRHQRHSLTSDFARATDHQSSKKTKNGVTWPRFVRAASAFCLVSRKSDLCCFFMFDLSPLHHVLNWQVFYIDICCFITNVYIIL